MLHLPPFEHVAAGSLTEAATLLATHGDRARLLAGGTDLLPRMKRRQDTPALLVGLRGVAGLDECQAGPDGWILGAGVTVDVLAAGGPGAKGQSAALPRGLREAAASVATPTIRRMGTLGGNLCQETRCSFFDQGAFWRAAAGGCMKCQGTICRVAPASDRCWAVAASDLAPALMALDATVSIVGPDGGRTGPLDQLYTGEGETPLALAV
ncbi:MAG: FAD binding domain-containing protein, partial [Anaerolineae bacterium]